VQPHPLFQRACVPCSAGFLTRVRIGDISAPLSGAPTFSFCNRVVNSRVTRSDPGDDLDPSLVHRLESLSLLPRILVWDCPDEVLRQHDRRELRSSPGWPTARTRHRAISLRRAGPEAVMIIWPDEPTSVSPPRRTRAGRSSSSQSVADHANSLMTNRITVFSGSLSMW
jgi:hypothetical protein